MISTLSRDQCNKLYLEVLGDRDEKAMKELCLKDLFFLLTVAFKRKDVNREFLFQRCREVEADPFGHLDLWSRDHYKSTIVTYAGNIQEILKDPEVTISIFSHTRPIAKSFLEQIKREFENNTFLQDLFPEILYKNPKSEAPTWSLDSGIVVKRKTNPKEKTVEAWGLVDGQPTGKHFKILNYDDVVTLASVNTPEQIAKTTAALELSYNLGSNYGGVRRFIGTRYHANDTYAEVMKRGTAKPRIYPATDNGKLEGNPVLLTREQIDEKRRDMGPYTFSCQMLQNPIADNLMGFKTEWLKYYEKLNYNDHNKYILVDPASKKGKSNDYTVMIVLGLGPDNNFYVIKGFRDRLNLTERAKKLFELHREFKPKDVIYEEYGLQADIEHIEYVQEQENYRFNITRVGGTMSKENRIRRLVPIFEQKRMWLPKTMYFFDYEGRRVDFVEMFLDNEYTPFPVCSHDDMLDCLSRIFDIDFKFPKAKPKVDAESFYGGSSDSWLGS